MKAVFKNFNIAICVVVLLAMLVVGFSSFADETATLTVSTSAQRVLRGDNVQVKVTLNDITAMAGLQFVLNFDSNALEIDGDIEINEALADKQYSTYIDKPGSIRIMGSLGKNYTVTTPIDIVTLNLKVNSKAEYKTYPIALKENKISIFQDNDTEVSVEYPSRAVNANIVVFDPTATPEPTPTPPRTGGGGGGGSTLQPVTPAPSETPTPSQTPGETEQPKIKFEDVSGWAEEYVYYLAEKGVVKGRSERIFAPNDNVTRAEFVTMVARSLGADGVTVGEGGSTFTDVSANDWFAPYVEWAAANNIVLGYEDGTFAPHKNITREELCTMIVRALTAYGKAPEEAELAFADAESVSDWAKSSIASLADMGIVSGKGNNMFFPKDLATRAETAKIIAGAFKEFIDEL